MSSYLSRKSLIVVSILLCAIALMALEFGRVIRAESTPTDVTVNAANSDRETLFPKAPAIGAARKISDEVLADTAGGKTASVVIYMAEQADVSAAYKMTDQDARGWYVYKTLSETAERTQAEVKAQLTADRIEFQSFWVANMLVAKADRSLLERLAARNDVARIDANRSARWIEDPSISDLHDSTSRPTAPETTESGVSNVNAPAVWALGFTGQNIVIANQDTGMRWTHNALKPKYRGWNGTVADHNYNWHDSIHSGGGTCGANTVEPCDDQGHGTHTTGTTIGDDGTGNQVGVAPGAKWIGCRNMNVGAGTPSTYAECFQFFIAPTDLTGSNPNPSVRPHVMNNSWGCPISEGCTTGAELETIVNNTTASGIFVVVSAGNDGPSCSSVSSGGNAGPPSPYAASFSVGAISGTTNTLQSFSSRGPSLFYTPNLLKPNISAPGASVRSSLRTNDTSYGTMSGTSMAGPHVVGVVALLWSARPQLARNIDATKTILQNTANPAVTVSPAQTCGGTTSTQIPNNSFGYGRVDVLAAVNATPSKTSAFDFDGDGKADISIFRPGTGEWWYLKSSNGGNLAATFGTATDKLTPGDFTGDGKTDFAFWRPSTGSWFVLRSEDFSFFSFPLGTSTDVPVPADYDADGKTDAAVFRPSTREWFINKSTGGTTISTFGAAGDQPVPADYDGDGKADIAIFRPGAGEWWLQRSTAGLTVFQFGNSSDRTVPGDYTGDGKADVAFFRPSTGEWFILRSENQSFYSFPFGVSTDTPAPGDYDGDGKFDAVLFRSSASTWFANRSTAGLLIQQFGQSGDMAVPNAFVH